MDMPPVGMDLSHMPAAPPPPGIQSNFIDPPTRAGTVIVASAILLTLSTFFVVLRCYTRFFLTGIYGLGDYLLLAGWGFAIANSSLPLVDITRGFGRHDWDVPLGNIFPFIARSIWWQIKLYVVSLCLVKLSILGLYLQLSPFRNYRAYVWVLAVLVLSLSLAGLLWSIFNCWPASNSWSFEATIARKCPLNSDFVYYTGITNILTDFAILILPMVILRHITLPFKRKIGVAIVLASGSLASIISIVRLIYSLKSGNGKDQSWQFVRLVIWSTSELHATVICACLPTLRPFVRRYFPPYLGGSTPNQSANSQPGQGAIELDAKKRKNPDELNSDSTTTSWVLERITKSKEGNGNRDNASEEEHILDDKHTAPSERDVMTAGRGQSAGTDIGQAV